VIVPGKRITEWSRRADGWAVVVHSGAGLASPERRPAHVAACEAAVVAAEVVLAEGGGAVDAAVAAVRVLENDVNTNAGTGAAPCRRGRARDRSVRLAAATSTAGLVESREGVSETGR